MKLVLSITQTNGSNEERVSGCNLSRSPARLALYKPIDARHSATLVELVQAADPSQLLKFASQVLLIGMS